jgi:hypothetical protein
VFDVLAVEGLSERGGQWLGGGSIVRAVADDVHVAAEREAQSLVERPAALRIGDGVIAWR